MAGKARMVKAGERKSGKNSLRQFNKKATTKHLNALQQALIDAELQPRHATDCAP